MQEIPSSIQKYTMLEGVEEMRRTISEYIIMSGDRKLRGPSKSSWRKSIYMATKRQRKLNGI